ncbi:hypothetical protein J4E93_002040 [Alternaria ventricosa]|uniref:uncharacterized protein n=1 Tax=Alternaria ventricosa TaxID=1187951 RepID=UPI0020C1F3DF|nr:uncharacterized protein J4E93_002040 [Alternaria ventricosa]KAI4651844.1 hypothetical protein J4E93_002040 [Alternaria ventricosa]
MAGRKRALEPAIDGGPAAATSTRRKRARKEVVNDKSLLLKLPGELRNRIYEFIMEDVKEYKKGKTSKAPKREGAGYRNFRNDEPIHIKYTSVKSRKRYKTDKQWATAHDRRPYFGLTQACRMLREEFRPLYMSELGFCIDLHVDKYLATFGANEEEQMIGQSVANIVQAPLSDVGTDLLPFLERLRELKQPRVDDYRVTYDGQQHWNRDNLLAILCYEWQQDTGDLTRAKTGITKITFVKSLEAERHKQSNEIPILVVDLDADFFVSQTQRIMKAHMEKLLYCFELEEVDNMVTQFRCGGESFSFRSEANWYEKDPATIVRLRD